MTAFVAIVTLIVVWVLTWFLNKRYDDDPIKDFLRYIGATFASMAIVFFWHWM